MKSNRLKGVDDNCLRFNAFSCCNLITNYEFVVYVAFSHVHFRRQKFSFQAYTARKPAPENGVDLWLWFLERVSWVSGLPVHSTVATFGVSLTVKFFYRAMRCYAERADATVSFLSVCNVKVP